MKWEQKDCYGKPVYRSGIYKLVSYTFHRGEKVPQFWVAYRILEHNWGDHVPGIRDDEQLTLSQVKAICERHAAGYTPTNKELTASNKSWAAI